MKERSDPRPVLAQLKGFQRDTVEYAFRRLYLDEDSTHRFLVADEVGLGKTLVARGVVAKAIDHLWDVVDRVDVVYICSNANIARQNVNRLTLPGSDQFALASRITLLPLALRELDKGSGRRVNFISFTPGTSFRLTGGSGVVHERVLLYWLLRDAWGFPGTAAPMNVFQAYAGRRRFRREIEGFPTSGRGGELPYDKALAERFVKAVQDAVSRDRSAKKPDLRSRFDDLCERFAWSREHIPPQDAHDRERFIGDLRTLLAKTCLGYLEPDLVILDEFQRFRDLLDGEDPAAELAHDLFSYADESTSVRVLLLSATPYKMYTLSHELEEDNHYEDFLRTIRFLERQVGGEGALSHLLKQYRQELYALGNGGGNGLEDVKREIEQRLRRVMVRTERLRVSGAGDGMMRDVGNGPLPILAKDVRSFTDLQRVATELEQPDVIEYWKSAPYLFNFMTGYKLKEALVERLSNGGGAELRDLLSVSPGLLLAWDDIERYAILDPGNSRLRSFVEDILAHRSAETLWIPPAAPYYPVEGAFAELAQANFTKRLVFSAWTVVPRVISMLLSYEAERRIFSQFESDPSNTPAARERRKALLTFAFSEERLTGMPVLALLYPSIALAHAGDPVTIRRDAGRALALKEQLAEIEHRIEPAIKRVTNAAPNSGPEDERWYWAAPLLVDMAVNEERAVAWLSQPDLPRQWSGTFDDGTESAGRWADHIQYAREVVRAPDQLGRPPADLCSVLALMALAGPSTAVLRSFSRLGRDGELVTDLHTRNASARVGWSFRSLFNQPEAMAILRAGAEDVPYWRRVLEYSAQGCLQAVLDEYGHLLRDFEGLFDKRGADLAKALADSMTPVIGLRTSNLALDEIGVEAADGAPRERRMRTRFAMRLGREKSEASESQSEVIREDLVRSAFNSPFWPYALVTTSIGQEGLDFHPYCHAIVHWNLPANPVDLEQREGRVHRFKGHAIRKNVAMRFGDQTSDLGSGDIWEGLFDLARAAGDGVDRGLSPYWVYPVDGGAFIERHVPCLPLSRDGIHLENLRRSLAVYRMVFGQPRQDDLMAYLLERVGPEVLEAKRSVLRISLAPPAAGESSNQAAAPSSATSLTFSSERHERLASAE